MRIERRRSSEYVDGNRVGLDIGFVAIEARIDYVLEKFGELRRTRKSRPDQDLLQRLFYHQS